MLIYVCIYVCMLELQMILCPTMLSEICCRKHENKIRTRPEQLTLLHLHFPHPSQPAETVWNWLWHCALYLDWIFEKSQLSRCKKSAIHEHPLRKDMSTTLNDLRSTDASVTSSSHAPTSRQPDWKNAVLFVFLFLLFQLELLLAKACKKQVELNWSAATSVGNTKSRKPVLASEKSGSQSKLRKTYAGTLQNKIQDAPARNPHLRTRADQSWL